MGREESKCCVMVIYAAYIYLYPDLMTHLGYLCCIQNLEKLKILKLSHSKKLTDIRVLSEAMNLEHIDLEGCTSLVDVSTSIPRCGKLVSLNMKDCFHLRSLPAMVDFTSLKLLELSGCSELEEIQELHQT